MTIDMDAIAAIKEIDSDGSTGLLKEIVNLFIDSIDPELSELKKVHLANDRHQVGEVAHRFKSSCQNVGAKNMAQLLLKLESEKETLSSEQRENIIQQIQSLAVEVRAELKKIIAT